MKKIIVALFTTVALAQAALVQFDLSPAGSDIAVGLSPSNTVPAVTNSTGSGNALAIAFDTDTGYLSFGVGYGSAAGFADLTAPATAMHLHGPAPAGSNAPAVVDLLPYHFPATNPAQGGVLFGAAPIPTNAVADLLAGLHYLNIHTPNYPDGEIRGQLVVRPTPNAPPTVVCPRAYKFQCSGRPTILAVRVGDPDGDPLTVVWHVNGYAMQTNQVAAGGPPTKGSVKFMLEFPIGTNQVQVAVTDGTGNLITCGTTVIVFDQLPPVILSAVAHPAVLWPPNHKMVEVTLRAEVKDLCGDARWKIISVTSDEPVEGLGDGNTAPDWEIVDHHTVNLRAERSGTGDGRIYTITVQAEDSVGNVSRPKVVRVTVPKSQGNERWDEDENGADNNGKGKGRDKGKR